MRARRRIESAARRLVVEKYDWAAVAQDFEAALARVARRDARLFPVSHADDVAVPIRCVGRTEMKVSVFGLGYVGSVSAASFAADGHTVVGVDVNPDKVASLNEGRSPIVEKGLDELIRDNAANGRLRATTQHQRGRRRDRPVADLRRHTEPQERQSRPLLPGARLRADWRGARGQARLPRRRRPQHGAAGDDPRGRDPGAGADLRQEVRKRVRRHGQSRVPARGHRDQGLPQSADDAGRPQLQVGRGADRSALRQGRGAAGERPASAPPR